MTLLLVGATAEAMQLADWLTEGGLAFVHRRSPAGRDPAALDEELSDEVRLTGLIRHARPRAVLDMSHPFDAEVALRLWRVAEAEGTPYLRYLRAPWQAGPGDLWHPVPDPGHLAEVIPARSVVFLAAGREALTDCAALAARGDTIWCRVLSEPHQPFPFARGGWLRGQAPFSREDEIACFRHIAAEWMIVRNAGGAGNTTKLEAARALGMQVAMIDQPKPPAGAEVTCDLARARSFAIEAGRDRG